jgi:hypothetical protein
MSLFGKQSDRPPPMAQEYAATGSGYGVADLIRLLKTLPVDHNPQLVVQVIKTTLESVGVHSSTVIDDAIMQENAIRDEAAMLETQIVELAREIEARRERIAELDILLAETIDAKNRLASAEPRSVDPSFIDLNQPQLLPPSEEGATFEPHGGRPPSLPPPLPPPRRKARANELPEPMPGR